MGLSLMVSFTVPSVITVVMIFAVVHYDAAEAAASEGLVHATFLRKGIRIR